MIDLPAKRDLCDGCDAVTALLVPTSILLFQSQVKNAPDFLRSVSRLYSGLIILHDIDIAIFCFVVRPYFVIIWHIMSKSVVNPS